MPCSRLVQFWKEINIAAPTLVTQKYADEARWLSGRETASLESCCSCHDTRYYRQVCSGPEQFSFDCVLNALPIYLSSPSFPRLCYAEEMNMGYREVLFRLLLRHRSCFIREQLRYAIVALSPFQSCTVTSPVTPKH